MKFILATGGTGGHLFPALRVARELRREGHDVLFLGSFTRGRAHIEQSGFVFEDLGARGFISVPWKEKCSSMVAMAGAVVRALRSLRAFRPDGVIGSEAMGRFRLSVRRFSCDVRS